MKHKTLYDKIEEYYSNYTMGQGQQLNNVGFSYKSYDYETQSNIQSRISNQYVKVVDDDTKVEVQDDLIGNFSIGDKVKFVYKKEEKKGVIEKIYKKNVSISMKDGNKKISITVPISNIIEEV